MKGASRRAAENLPKRKQLIGALERELRHANAQAVLYSRATARRLGAGDSDLDCLDMVNRCGSVSTSELAAATGLTTGAIAGVVDRLENAGYVERLRDPKDRRKVLVRLRAEALTKIAPLQVPMQQAMAPVYAGYTNKELALLIDFFRRSHRAGVEATLRLRGAGK